MARSATLTVATGWLRVAIVTFAVGFGILGYLAYRIYADQPPVPAAFIGPDGRTLFTRDEILRGQRVFETRGLMEQGTLFGHGAYLGPDFTAEAIHRMELAMGRYYGDSFDTSARIRADFKTNHLDGERVRWSGAQVAGWDDLVAYYASWLARGLTSDGLRGPRIDDPEDIRGVAAYVAWSAWVA